jgi:hypothetical protein
MIRVNHAAAARVNEKVPITWVQIAPLPTIPIHSQRLARIIGGNFRLTAILSRVTMDLAYAQPQRA